MTTTPRSKPGALPKRSGAVQPGSGGWEALGGPYGEAPTVLGVFPTSAEAIAAVTNYVEVTSNE